MNDFEASTNNPEVILQPNDLLDVLCGAGKAASEHPGNKRFRAIVAKSYYSKYTTVTSKTEKMNVTRGVMHELLSSGCARFLKKDPIFERFYVASHRAGRDKVSHSLRELKTACNHGSPQ
jgi:hypothetical protein